MTAPIDYRALRKEVREKQQNKRTLKYPICLNASLYDDLLDLQEQAKQEAIDSIGQDDPRPADARAGTLDAASKLKVVEERIAEASVIAVFNIPSPEQQAARASAWEALQAKTTDADAGERQQHLLESAKNNVLNTFSHFLDGEGNRIPAESFGLEDLRELVTDWPQGLMFAISTEIAARSTEEPDFPFSARRSLLHPTSVETSRSL